MKKIILWLLLFGLGFLTCYTIFVDSNWFKFGLDQAQMAANDCDRVIEEIKKYDWDVKLATAVMKAETKCNINAKGDTEYIFEENGREYGYSMGAFQVRILPGREECDTFDLETNVRCAYNIYVKAEREFTDWTMFVNGKYHEYLD
ncbi:hypothetical protein IKF74_01460 [Candidatus Saccharibacteria bacterium]|nr:hypothetical protein [Candidatus Saccharibacteria bacterium]